MQYGMVVCMSVTMSLICPNMANMSLICPNMAVWNGCMHECDTFIPYRVHTHRVCMKAVCMSVTHNGHIV